MIHIVGPGGAGQTYFTEFLKSNGVNTTRTHDIDNIKHVGSPLDIEKSYKKLNYYKNVSKCIFIYNDSCKCILSLIRRAYITHQLKKFGDPYNLLVEKTKNKTENWYSFIFKKTIDEGKDISGIEYQFDNWVKYTKLPTLFIHFNDVLKYKDIIKSFINKDINFDLFEYQYKNRKNNSEIIGDFIEIYNKLDNKLRKFSGKVITNI